MLENQSTLDPDEPRAWHRAITPGPDLLVHRTRPVVADLVGPGRIGLGTLLASEEPLVIAEGLGYRLDGGMSAARVSSAARVRHATAVDFRPASRFPIEHSACCADLVQLVADVLGSLPQIVAVEVLGSFSHVAVPNGVFGRTLGLAVGFITSTKSVGEWQMSFLTADRTFGGPILEISIESAELRIVTPRVVYQAQSGPDDG